VIEEQILAGSTEQKAIEAIGVHCGLARISNPEVRAQDSKLRGAVNE